MTLVSLRTQLDALPVALGSIDLNSTIPPSSSFNADNKSTNPPDAPAKKGKGKKRAREEDGDAEVSSVVDAIAYL